MLDESLWENFVEQYRSNVDMVIDMDVSVIGTTGVLMNCLIIQKSVDKTILLALILLKNYKKP